MQTDSLLLIVNDESSGNEGRNVFFREPMSCVYPLFLYNLSFFLMLVFHHFNRFPNFMFNDRKDSGVD